LQTIGPHVVLMLKEAVR